MSVIPQYQKIPCIPQAALIAANVVPLLGVIFLGWQASTILAIYWAETGVIGFYTILRIIYAGREDTYSESRLMQLISTTSIAKVFVIGFFIFHFGVFMFVHGVFLIVIISEMTAAAGQFNFFGLFIGIISLFASHGISFYRNYFGAEEFKKVSPKELMTQPYKRVAVMHMVIIVSMFAFTFVGSFSITALLLLIILKTAADLNSHVKEHYKLQ